MKKKDIVLIFIILVFALAIWLVYGVFFCIPGGRLLIWVDNQEYAAYDLSEDQTVTIGDTNVCRIEDGVVTMIQADCPDQICVHSRGISQNGQTIICLPNKVVLEIAEADESPVDTIAE